MWRLETTDLGRQRWIFDNKLSATPSFDYTKKLNPNSADKLYRQTQLDKKRLPLPEGLSDTEQHLFGAINFYQTLQADSGHWPGDYGGPMFLLPGLIIASHVTDSPFEQAEVSAMKSYMQNHQNEDGGWGLHLEGNSSMFCTVLQYVSLRILGSLADEPNMAKARHWIQKNGGAVGIPSWGKFYLSLLNVYEWDGCQSLFPEMWLLPKWLPFHPWRYWCHARMVYLGMSYCYANKVKAKETAFTICLRQEIYNSDYNKIDWNKAKETCAPTDLYHKPTLLLKVLNKITSLYEKVAVKSWREKASDFLLNYIQAEDDHTNYIDIGPVNQVINSVAIWFAFGKKSIHFNRHRERWQDYLWMAEDGMKMQGYNGSQLWDTAFATQAILEGGMEPYFKETIERAYTFLNKSQVQTEVRDTSIFFRHRSVGGWPFSTVEHGWPITDCTAEGLKTVLDIHHQKVIANPVIANERLTLALDLLLSFQNKDGGWASYELTRAPAWIEALNPSEIFGNIMVDYSYTECTSACLQALAKWQKTFPTYKTKEVSKAINKGINFILKQQKTDGSWYGSWAVCFTYGTWFAIEALEHTKSTFTTSNTEVAQQKAALFLLSKQNEDGGWGESFESCITKVYISSPTSQVVNTAWALLTLMAIDFTKYATEITNGIKFLTSRQSANGDFPQENISGVFNHSCMITYTSYRNVFPIWALGRYARLTRNDGKKTTQQTIID